MELKIQIDETKFKDVIEKELNAFSKEELHDILKECIIEAFRDDRYDSLRKSLFVEKVDNSYYSTKKYEPGVLLLEAARSIDMQSECKELADELIKTFKENHKELLENLMLSLMVRGLTYNDILKTDIETVASIIINNNRNQGDL